MRFFREKEVQVGCHKWGVGVRGDCFDVRPQCRKAMRQVDQGQDRQQESLPQGGQDGYGLRQSRVRMFQVMIGISGIDFQLGRILGRVITIIQQFGGHARR
jgi:hypothetical protein